MCSSLRKAGFPQQLTVTAALATCIALACDSPGGPDPATIPVELRLSADSVRVFEGSSVQLTSTLLNGDGTIIDASPQEWPIIWHSLNESVAIVVDGLVTGVSPGESAITASSGELSDQAIVDVRAVPTAEDLVLAMDIAPDTLGSGGSFVIHYRISNTARDTAVLETPGTYLADLRATRDGQEFAFGGGPGGGLWTGDWRIAPGATLEEQIHVTAAIVPDWIPADPGVYTITLESNVVEINGRQAYLPSMERELVLVPAPTLEDLTFAMSVEPDTVAPGESFLLSYSITNTASVQVVLRFPSSCIYLAAAYRGDERVFFQGTMHGCRAAFTDWEIAPGATLTRYLGASATLLVPPGFSEQVPAEPGSYTIVFRAEPPIWINRHPAELPALSDTLTVAG